MKRVKSTDPRKKIVMRAFRMAYEGASKITDVIDLGNGEFKATLHRHIGNKKYERLGVYGIVCEEFMEAVQAENASAPTQFGRPVITFPPLSGKLED